MSCLRILIASGKGGQGKSSLSCGLACEFAIQRHLKTALIELNYAERCLDIYLGCENQVIYDLGDLFSESRTPAGVVTCPLGIDYLYYFPACYHPKKFPTKQDLETFLDRIETDLELDIMIIDTSNSADTSIRYAASSCDLVLLTATPSNVSLRSCGSLYDLLHDWRVDNVRLVINQLSVDPNVVDPVSIREMIDSTGIQLIGLVPNCKEFAQGQDEGIPALYNKKAQNVSQAYSNIATRILGKICPLLFKTDLNRKKILKI